MKNIWREYIYVGGDLVDPGLPVLHTYYDKYDLIVRLKVGYMDGII